MAEVLFVTSLASSIVQFVDFGVKVIDRLNEFQSSINEVPKTFCDIKNQLPLLIDALRRTQSQAEAGDVSEKTAEALKPVVSGCLSQVKLLDDIIVKAIPAENASTWNRSFKALSSLAHDKKVQQITSTLEGYVQKLIYHQVTSGLDQIRLLVREPSQKWKFKTPLFMVKFDRDLNFVGREDVLKEIDERHKMQRRHVAIAGIGGVGKSQVAIEYCYRYSHDHPEAQVFWVHASNHARFEEAYKGIARELALPRFDDPNANTLQIVSKWLSDDANGPWLMVLDNADDMEMFFGCSNARLSLNGQQSRTALVDFLPRSLNGLMLITTRDRRVGERLANREKPIAVLPFGMHDAECLLRSKLPDGHEWNEAESMELLEALGFLPLAITQAVAYISEEEVTLAHYLDLLRSGDSDIKDLFAQGYYDPRRDSEIQNSIFLTWKISFDQIRKQKQRAAEVLSLMAVLDRQSISEILLRKEDEGKVSFDTAIGTLKAFSLITDAKKEAAFGMHRLVQLSMQWWLERKHALVEYQQRALGAVSACCPSSGDYENWAAWEAISPHIEVVLGYIFEMEHCLLKRASILNNAAWYDVLQGRYGAANKKGMEALAIRQRSLGKEHPSTLTSMSNLANALWCQGKYGEVKEMHRLVLKGREKVLGGEHPDTLMSMNNLAVALGSQGRCEEAEEMHRLVLKGREKVLGKEHLDTLMSMHNLATVLECQGKYEKAEEMHWRALRVMEKVPGKEHPDTLMSMNNLALVLVGQGRYEEAEELHRQVLKGKEKMLGPEHPSTLMSMNNLAEAARSLGKYGEAEKAHRVALEMREKILGKEHPDTLMSLSNLALVLECQDKCEEAEGTHRRASGVRTEVLAKEYWLH